MEVWPGVLVSFGDRSRGVVEQQLRELVRKEFLTRVKPSSVQGEHEYRFRHALVRDEAYRQIPRLRKIEIHRRTAEWLESLSPDRATERSEMLALHYMSAYENAVAANADAGSLVEGARVALRDAGDRALALNAFAAAERHYQEAVDLSPEDDPERPWLMLRVGRSRYYAYTDGGGRPRGGRGTAPCCGRSRVGGRGRTGPGGPRATQRSEPSERVFEHLRRARCACRRPRVVAHEGPGAPRRWPHYLGLADGQRTQAIALATQALHDAESSSSRRSRQARSPSSGSCAESWAT